jgi:hypothetical protein
VGRNLCYVVVICRDDIFDMSWGANYAMSWRYVVTTFVICRGAHILVCLGGMSWRHFRYVVGLTFWYVLEICRGRMS